MHLEAFRRAGIMIPVALVAGTEGIGVRFAVARGIGGAEDVAGDFAGAGNSLSVEGPARAELDAGIHAADTVVLARGGAFPVGVENADARLTTDVTRRPGDREIGTQT